MSRADIFIPVVTPSFLNSQWCRREVDLFNQKRGLQGANLIFPIYYIRSDAFDDPQVQRTDDVVETLRRSNWIDWTAMRRAEPASAARREAIIDAAERLARALAAHRTQVAPDREEEARELYGIGLDLVDTNPRQAVTALNHLLRDYPNSPLVYRLMGTIARARALVNLGQPQAAVAQLDVLIDRLQAHRPNPKGDPTMQRVIGAHLVLARDLRAEITGEDTPASY